jgi:branched-chain amino acid transport system permease protein
MGSSPADPDGLSGADGLTGAGQDGPPWVRWVRAWPVTASLLIGLVATVLIYSVASAYWLFLITSGAISIVVMQGFGVIVGRAGVITLCQMSFAGIGAWIVGWCNVHSVPGGFYVWLLVGALAAVVAGVLIGLPALRLRGVNLAVATFAFATSVDVIFSAVNFPGQDNNLIVERPAGFVDDNRYLVLVVVVIAAIFLGLRWFDRTRTGGALIEIRHSERAAAAHGINVARSKVLAFAISAFIAGIAGGLMAGQLGLVQASNFVSGSSIAMFAVALFVGTHNPEGAIFGGILGALFPVLLDKIGLPQDLGALFFGVGAVLVLKAGGSQTDLDRAKRRRKRVAALLSRPRRRAAEPALAGASSTTAVPRQAPATTAEPVLKVSGLTVKFGTLTAVNNIDLELPAGGILGLVGPNGAGKSTLINTVTGFVRDYAGTVSLNGAVIDGLSAHKRAKAGVRRSFQQLRVPPALTVGMFLQVAAGRKLTNDEIQEHLDWFDCPPAECPIDVIDVGTRRILEVAGLAAGRPPVLLLDEPAAGQSAEQTEALAARLAEIPARSGSAVVLVEHDIELVRSTCDTLAVLDFGQMIAYGLPEQVLQDPRVVAAYLGGDVPAEPQAPSDSPTPQGDEEQPSPIGQEN